MQNNEPEQQQHDQEAAAAAKVEAFFSSMAQAMIAITQEQQSIRDAVSRIDSERAEIVQLLERLTGQVAGISETQTSTGNAILSVGKLLPLMDQRITLIATLADHHHILFIKHGWAAPRPEGGSLAN